MTTRFVTGFMLMVVGLTPAGALAQSIYAEGAALEFRTDLPWASLHLFGEEEISGVSPLRVPGALTGDYWLRASALHAETQLGRVRITLDDTGSRIASYGRQTLGTTLLQSLYPGISQYMSEQKWKGVTMGVTGFFALNAFAWATVEMWDADNAVQQAKRDVDNADTELKEDLAAIELEVAREEKTYAADRRNLTLVAVGVTWGVSLLDATIFRPPFRVSHADESSIALEMRPKKRFDAMIRSLVFPGLGQDYNGQGKKAWLVGVGGIALGTWTLRTQDRYNRAATDYRIGVLRYEGATNIDDQNLLARGLDSQYDEVEDRKRMRDIAVLVTGIYWVANIVDAAIYSGSPWGEKDTPESGFGMTLDPVDGTLAANLRF